VKQLLAVLLLALPAGIVVAQDANPFTGGARLNYAIIKSFVTRAAAKMPEELYGFRPAPNVRSFAQLVAHVADANYRLCSVVGGEDPPRDAGIEKRITRKDDLANALAESFRFCDTAYEAMTDAAGAPVVQFEAGGEGARVPVQMPKLTVLAFHAQHAFEHYGNMVTYMRVQGIVPPSSEPTTP
jgi:uncharacterized damage-inducible protein DinB